MYSEEDVHRCKEMLLSDLKILCRSFGISTAHAIQVFVVRWQSAELGKSFCRLNVSFTKISSGNTGGKDNQVETTN